MTAYQVICATKQHDHRHIITVGTGKDDLVIATKVWSVAQVRTRLAAGDRFFTTDSQGRAAEIEPYTCPQAGCRYQTLRTKPDAETDNNLDDIRDCRSS